MLSRKLIKRQPRRRLITYAAGLSLLALTLGIAGSALAVHDLVFQLDGDTSTARGTTPTAGQTLDWDSLFNGDGTKKTGAFNETATSSAFTAGTFIRDFGVKVSRTDACNLTDTTSTTFCTADPSTFATGSKDTLDITPGWQCNKDNNVNSKIDIMNAYAAQYLDGSTPAHRIMYFGLDKNKDNGNNNVAFWFLRSGATCSSPSGSTDFTGKHQNGDVLVVSAFTNGGGVSNITAYMWNNGCIDNPSPATPGACDGLAIGNGGDCKVNSSGGDSICATTNSGPNVFNTDITTQWLTSDATLGVGTKVVPPDFFEGGIDLTAVFGSVGATVPSCFSTFIADTRSSQSLTATLFDFAAGQLGQCTTTLTTQQNSGGPLSIGTGTVSSGTDTATLTVNGATTWAGTLDFYLCGPSVSSCDTHGVLVTSTPVSSADASHVYVSASAYLTSAGSYCWHAKFTPDADSLAGGVGGKEDNGANECFTVNAVTPTLTTSASCSASPCILGSTLSDRAYLTGTATKPGSGGPGGDTGSYKSIYLVAPSGLSAADGTITWTLYGPAANGSAQCTTTKTLTTNTATVSGNRPPPPPSSNTGYGPITYVTSAANDGLGTYTFAAVYPGSSPNTLAAADVTCANGAAEGEQVTIGSTASTSTTQKWLPQDSAHVTAQGGATVAGYVVFQLFESTDCTGTAVQTFGGDPNARITVDASGNASTNNSTYYVDKNIQISWKATFTSTNGVASGSPAPCERSDIANLDDDITSP